MTVTVTPTMLYVGSLSGVRTELATPDYLVGKFAGQLSGDGDWDAFVTNYKRELLEHIAEIKAAYPGIKICWVD